MHKATLKTLHENLKLNNVVLRAQRAESNDDMPWDWDKVKKNVQLRFLSSPLGRLEGEGKDNDSKHELYIFRHRLGVQLVGEAKKDKELPIYAQIEADYDIVFTSQSKLDFDDELAQEFSFDSVKEVWPFWRELVQSTCLKCGFTGVILPFETRDTISKVAATKAKKG